ncbi:Gmk: guanylate kinase [Desulfosarcina variabilis str. Montpellier]|uniref:guanylate kinase n=1 Tax=Desulfosarcina variabilis TaxID=2300 RepID=UPI003AFAF7B0
MPFDPTTPSSSSSGRLFVVSAPSGAGKTTLCKAARAHLPELVYSISSTTRAPRPGEQEGQDYFFLSEAQFRQGIEDEQWAEWAKVHDHYYGTSARFIDRHLELGQDVLLDIDVQGARQILKRYPSAVTIFIMAPSMDVLRERLVARGQDAASVIEKRLKNAASEIASKDWYQHVVVNDALDVAIEHFIAILKGGAD